MKHTLDELIEASDKLTSILGAWPKFHDAEVVELYFERGEINAVTNVFEDPNLTAKFLLFDETGVLPLEHQTIVTLQFSRIEDFTMKDFNHQNSIYGLRIEAIEAAQSHFNVCIDGALGMSASFNCYGIKVLNAITSQRGARPKLWLTANQLAEL